MKILGVMSMGSVPERMVFKLNSAPLLKGELRSIYSGFGAGTPAYPWRTLIGRFSLLLQPCPWPVESYPERWKIGADQRPARP